MRTVVYCRVSTTDISQKTSIEAQEAHYTKFCKMEGLNLLKVYADEGFTGTNSNREGFQNMLQDAGLKIFKFSGKNNGYDVGEKEPLMDLIVVKDVSRFARNSSEAGNIVKALREKNVHILFENNGINTKDIDNDTNLSFMFSMAEAESKLNSKRQKFSYRSAMERDIFLAKSLPYGYTKDEKKRIIADEEKAKVVQYVFARALEVGSRTIARELNEQGIPTQKGKQWGATQINQMLINTLYYGTATVNKTNKLQLTSIPKATQLEDRKQIPNVVEKPIISKEQWEEANKAFKARKSESGLGAKQPKTHDIFFRKITCGNCGGKYGRNRSTRKNKNGTVKHYFNYYCTERNKKSVCESTIISFNLLCRLISQEKPTFGFDQGFGHTHTKILQAIEQAKNEQQSIISRYEEAIDELELKMKDIEEKIMILKSEATIKRLENAIEEHTEKVKDLQVKISNLNTNNLDRLAVKTKSKFEEIKKLKKKKVTDKQKLEQASDIRIFDDYIRFKFDTPNYEEIIKEYNSLVDDSLLIEESRYEVFANEHYVYKSEEIRKDYQESSLDETEI